MHGDRGNDRLRLAGLPGRRVRQPRGAARGVRGEGVMITLWELVMSWVRVGPLVQTIELHGPTPKIKTADLHKGWDGRSRQKKKGDGS